MRKKGFGPVKGGLGNGWLCPICGRWFSHRWRAWGCVRRHAEGFRVGPPRQDGRQDKD